MYLRSDQDQPFIARIDKMWTDTKYDTVVYIFMYIVYDTVDEDIFAGKYFACKFFA